MRPYDLVVTTNTDSYSGVTMSHVDGEQIQVLLPFWDADDSIIGTSKCMTEDVFDEDLGELFSVGRVLQQMGELFIKEAYSQVRYREKQEEYRRECSAKALEAKREKTYRFQCEFAELIEAVQQQDVVPTTRYRITGSLDSDNGSDSVWSVNGKAYPLFNDLEIRKDLPA
jgi:hypothetical protein